MSFLITTYVNEGIVMASDSRTTYTRTEKYEECERVLIGTHTTNSTEKTFLCPNGSGISTCGCASVNGKPITGFIQAFMREKVRKETDVEEIPQLLLDYFRKFDPIPDTIFQVAGYSHSDDKSIQKVYRVFITGNTFQPAETDVQGAIWNGETIYLTKMLNSTAIKNNDGTYSDLPQSYISFEYFTLQDAVDFARYAVEMTINTRHFENVVETVGGNVDILVITPEESKWLQHKELK